MRRRIGLAAAAVAMAVVPMTPARAQGGECIDVTITQLPQGFHVSAPYSCEGCGPLVKSRPISGGAVYTINMGCPRL